MNKSLITGLVVGGVAVTAAGAFAGYQAMDHGQSAEVLNVEPLTRIVRTQRKVCSDVIVSHQATTNDPNRVTGTMIGAVAGGVLGNQIGNGSGQTVATVGTANFDNRSFRLNFEVTAMIVDPAFGRQMEAMFEQDFAHAEPITPWSTIASRSGGGSRSTCRNWPRRCCRSRSAAGGCAGWRRAEQLIVRH